MLVPIHCYWKTFSDFQSLLGNNAFESWSCHEHLSLQLQFLNLYLIFTTAIISNDLFDCPGHALWLEWASHLFLYLATSEDPFKRKYSCCDKHHTTYILVFLGIVSLSFLKIHRTGLTTYGSTRILSSQILLWFLYSQKKVASREQNLSNSVLTTFQEQTSLLSYN